MTASILDLRFTERIPPPVKKRRVLLVDSSRAKRDLRAEIMRKLGMDVDCAEDISEARTWWRADLYNLVLISAENEHGRRDRFCEDIRGQFHRSRWHSWWANPNTWRIRQFRMPRLYFRRLVILRCSRMLKRHWQAILPAIPRSAGGSW